MSTTHQPTPLDCILDPTLAPKPVFRLLDFTIANSRIEDMPAHQFASQSRSRNPIEKRWNVEVIADASDGVELHMTPARSTAPTPSFQAFCGRADDGVMVYPPACADIGGVHYTVVDPAVPGSERTGWIEIDVPPLPDKIQASRLHGFTYGICQPFDPDKYTFDPEEGRRLRMLAEQVCSPHDTCPERVNDFDREAAFELAKMIHAKHQANVEIARILSPVKPQ